MCGLDVIDADDDVLDRCAWVIDDVFERINPLIDDEVVLASADICLDAPSACPGDSGAGEIGAAQPRSVQHGMREISPTEGGSIRPYQSQVRSDQAAEVEIRAM